MQSHIFLLLFSEICMRDNKKKKKKQKDIKTKYSTDYKQSLTVIFFKSLKVSGVTNAQCKLSPCLSNATMRLLLINNIFYM